MRDFFKRAAVKKYAALITVLMLAAVMVLMAGCTHINLNLGNGGSESKPKEQASADSGSVIDTEEEVLNKVVPPEDFEPAGEYQDETSERAMMTITHEGEEDHYQVEISWGSSAFETTIWEFDGNFDPEGGMISYDNCAKYELKLDEDGYQQETAIYKNGKGALLYYEDGWHWDDKKENAGKDCHFIKIDDLSDTVIEEDDEESEEE